MFYLSALTYMFSLITHNSLELLNPKGHFPSVWQSSICAIIVELFFLINLYIYQILGNDFFNYKIYNSKKLMLCFIFFINKHSI